MKAIYAGKCKGCDTPFSVGDEIYNASTDSRYKSWRIVGCKVCENRMRAIEIEKQLEISMRENHRVLLGYDFGKQYPGYKQTDNLDEFLTLALKAGELSAEDDKFLRSVNSYRTLRWSYAD